MIELFLFIKFMKGLELYWHHYFRKELMIAKTETGVG